jgi:hypothetical protein
MWLRKDERQILIAVYKNITYDKDGKVEFHTLESILEQNETLGPKYAANNPQEQIDLKVIVNRLVEYELIEFETGEDAHLRKLIDFLLGKSIRLTLKGWRLAEQYSTWSGTFQQWYIAHREHWLYILMAFVAGIIISKISCKS